MVNYCCPVAAIISIMLQFHRLSSFRQEDFQSFNQSEHIIGPGSHVGFPIYTKITNLVEDLPRNISAKFGPNLFSGFTEEDENMKSLQMRTTTMDAKWWQKLKMSKNCSVWVMVFNATFNNFSYIYIQVVYCKSWPMILWKSFCVLYIIFPELVLARNRYQLHSNGDNSKHSLK